MELGFSLRRGSVGEPGGGLFTGDSERQMKEGSGNPSQWELCEANLDGGF
jgi:hypothetical protein